MFLFCFSVCPRLWKGKIWRIKSSQKVSLVWCKFVKVELVCRKPMGKFSLVDEQKRYSRLVQAPLKSIWNSLNLIDLTSKILINRDQKILRFCPNKAFRISCVCVGEWWMLVENDMLNPKCLKMFGFLSILFIFLFVTIQHDRRIQMKGH